MYVTGLTALFGARNALGTKNETPMPFDISRLQPYNRVMAT